MFEKFYTTKMSTNGRELRLRFEKIRRGRGRFTRLAGSVMAAVMLITLTCATIAMAAVGTDRPEHWDREELYFADGLNFDINIKGLNVPEYIKRDVAGADGAVHCEFRRYDMRRTDGFTDFAGVLSLSGDSGTMTMPWINNMSVGPDREAELINKYGAESITSYFFSTDGAGTMPEYFGCTATEDVHRISIYFAVAQNGIKNVIFSFDPEYIVKDLRQVNIGQNMDSPEISNIEFLGGMGDTALSFGKTLGVKVFNTYEQRYYKNLSVDGFDVRIDGADENGISVRNDISFADIPIRFAIAEIYDGDNNRIFYNNVYDPDLSGIMRIDHPNDEKLVSGKTYRVDIAYCTGAMETIIYRWQDYVTIP